MKSNTLRRKIFDAVDLLIKETSMQIPPEGSNGMEKEATAV